MNFFIPLRIYLTAKYLIDDTYYFWEKLVAQLASLFLDTPEMRDEFIKYISDLDDLDEEQIYLETEFVNEDFKDFIKSKETIVESPQFYRQVLLHIKDKSMKLWFVGTTIIHPNFITLMSLLGVCEPCEFIALKDYIEIADKQPRVNIQITKKEMDDFIFYIHNEMYGLPSYLSIPDLRHKDYSRTIHLN